MTTSRKVIVTPLVFFALLDRNHPKHTQADAYFRYFAQEKFQVYTPSFSVAKTYTDIKKHMSYSIAKDFLRTIYTGNIEVLYPDEAVTRNALKLLFSDPQANSSFDHMLINALADRYKIPQICSFEYNKFYFGINLFNLPY